MLIKNMFNVVNNKNEVVGRVQRESFNNGLLIYSLNTKSIGISFKSVAELKDYINKFEYRIV